MISESRNNREMLTPDNALESEVVIRQREEAAIQQWLKNKEGPNTPEWGALLERIDFTLLRKVFAEVATRCGISEARMNFVDRKRIFSSSDEDCGHYSTNFNVIIFGNPGEPARSNPTADREGLRKETLAAIQKYYGSTTFFQLACLVHEETHAVSRNVCMGFGEYVFSLQSGYSRDHYLPRKRFFSGFNEGVVDRLSREILITYCDRAGWSEEDVKIFKRTLQEHKDRLPYGLEIGMVDAIVRKLSQKNNQSQRIVWEALVRGLFNGETFKEEDIIALFVETFGDHFLQDLSELTTRGFAGVDRGALDVFMKKYQLS